MNKISLGLFSLILPLALSLNAHPGGLNKSGCHKQKNVGYHCHPERANPSLLKNTIQKDTGGFRAVERVVDGDTLVVKGIGKIRLIGVNTPETKDPRRPAEYFGKEASQFTKQLVTGKKVRLEYEANKKDKFQRTLAYVYLEDGTFLNAKLIEEGYAFAYTKFPFAYSDKFKELELRAKKNNKGLWKKRSS